MSVKDFTDVRPDTEILSLLVEIKLYVYNVWFKMYKSCYVL